MREAYKEIMDRISVTDEMRARILANVQRADPGNAKPRSPLSPYLAAAACLALLAVGAAVLPTLHIPPQPENPSGIQSGTLNRTEAASLAQLSQLVGFEAEELTYLPFDADETLYMAYNGEMAEITYRDETHRLVFRTMPGASDPSGDYTSYPDVLTLVLDGIPVTLKGESGLYSLALWQDASYSRSIQSSHALSQQEWTRILAPVI